MNSYTPKIFGDRMVFAIEIAFKDDPDNGRGASREDALSWGKVAIWVKGRNLCCNSGIDQPIDPYVHWYLYPLLRWLTDNFCHLVLDESLPAELAEGEESAADGFESQVMAIYGQEGDAATKAAEAWWEWRQHHALWSARCGGPLPNLFFRRVQGYVEISQGNEQIAGIPDGAFRFIESYKMEFVKQEIVIKVLQETLKQSVAMLVAAHPDVPAFQQLKSDVDGAFYADKQKTIPCLSSLIDKIGNFIGASGNGLVSPPIALAFGSAPHLINNNDVKTIIDLCQQNKTMDTSPLDRYVDEVGYNPSKKPARDGYDLALDFLEVLQEDFPEVCNRETILDMDRLYDCLGICLEKTDLTTKEIRGIALAGDEINPTVLINNINLHNLNEAENSGRYRFTLAHELCHLLYDRSYGRLVGIISSPWAPKWIEQRANGFAAMLLMPPDILDWVRQECTISTWNKASCTAVAKKLKVGYRALVQHLYNTKDISQVRRDELLNSQEQEQRYD